MTFSHVHILGCGLIGSSIARAVREHIPSTRITVSDASEDVCGIALGLGFADAASEDPMAHVGNADLVILATPPGVMGTLAKTVIPAMKPGSVLSDVGSIKSSVVEAVSPHMRDDIDFVPAHPIAGTENSGPEAGFAHLFHGRWCILTPVEGESEATDRVRAFWEALGSDVAVMEPLRHDIVLATTSHVPHLIAYTLVGTAMDMETVTRNEVVKFSAGGFRDFTRIAASDPIMWRDVFMQNKDAVLEIVDRFVEDLSAIKRAIRWDKDEVLLEHFSRTRDVRRRIVDAGQDSAEPNFGRNDGDD